MAIATQKNAIFFGLKPEMSGGAIIVLHKQIKFVAKMADQKPTVDPEVPFAKRIDPNKEDLTRDEFYFIRQVELAQWKKKSQQLRGRNIATGLAIGAIVMGIYGYTFYSVKQEKIMDELDEEAKVARMRGVKTGAN
ncbi:hypothetical protein J4Q44_G00277000 [Coregonus suidteri]|uniref:Cytochrome c oxidase assembly factor 3 n=2 Tax=Coregonus TaxID=27772 RepID=A0AAN8L1R8_9TELE